MSDAGDVADVFAIPDFWKPSKWQQDDLLDSATQFFHLDLNDLSNFLELPWGTSKLISTW
jgi:hypothetical protein